MKFIAKKSITLNHICDVLPQTKKVINYETISVTVSVMIIKYYYVGITNKQIDKQLNFKCNY